MIAAGIPPSASIWSRTHRHSAPPRERRRKRRSLDTTPPSSARSTDRRRTIGISRHPEMRSDNRHRRPPRRLVSRSLSADTHSINPPAHPSSTGRSPRNEPRSSNASIHTTRQPAAAAVTANRRARRLPARIGPQITTTASPNTNGASPSERTTTGSADTARLRQLDEQLERTGTFVPIHIGTDGALLVKRLCRRRSRRRHERVSYRSR